MEHGGPIMMVKAFLYESPGKIGTFDTFVDDTGALSTNHSYDFNCKYLFLTIFTKRIPFTELKMKQKKGTILNLPVVFVSSALSGCFPLHNLFGKWLIKEKVIIETNCRRKVTVNQIFVNYYVYAS